MGIGGGSIVTVRNTAGSVFLLFKHLFPTWARPLTLICFQDTSKCTTSERRSRGSLRSTCWATVPLHSGWAQVKWGSLTITCLLTSFKATGGKKPKLLFCSGSCLSAAGSQWIGVPGELRGYEAIHRQYGKLPWDQLFEETIRLARNGIKMPPFLKELLKEPLIRDHVEKSSLWYKKKKHFWKRNNNNPLLRVVSF